jgi:hypothetical protein
MTFHFEFINGPLDGKRVSGESEEPRDARFARFLKIATGGGSPGRWFRGLSPDLLSDMELKRVASDELKSIVFEVAEKCQEDEGTVVHLRQRAGSC